jgi:hypothetical protein
MNKKPNLLEAAKRGAQSSATNVKDRFGFDNASEVILGQKPVPVNEAKPTTEQPEQKPARPEKKAKVKAKPGPKAIEKTIKDIFSMPESDHKQIAAITSRGARLGSMLNKSQVVRIGLMALNTMNDSQFETAVRNFIKRETERRQPSKVEQKETAEV